MRKLNLPKGIDPKATLSTRVMSPLLFCYPSLVGVGEGFAISRGWDLCGSTLPAGQENIFGGGASKFLGVGRGTMRVEEDHQWVRELVCQETITRVVSCPRLILEATRGLG